MAGPIGWEREAGGGENIFDVPLGGWFRRPCYEDIDFKHFWQLKLAIPYHCLSKKQLFFYLYDDEGSRLRASFDDVLDIFSHHCPSSILWLIRELKCDLAAENSGLKDAECRFNMAVNAAIMAVAAIAESSRFGYSKEGAEIRRKLTEAIIAIFPQGDPHIKILQAMLKEKVGRKKAKMQAAGAPTD